MLKLDGSTMGFHQATHDGQPKPRAAHGINALDEAVEKALAELICHPRAAVSNPDHRAFFLARVESGFTGGQNPLNDNYNQSVRRESQSLIAAS